MSVDLEGHFAVGRVRCHPLTGMDAYGRYRVACVALRRPDAAHVRRAFERIFDEFGLPEAIRTDHGSRREHPERDVEPRHRVPRLMRYLSISPSYG